MINLKSEKNCFFLLFKTELLPEFHFEQYTKSIKLNGAFQVTVLNNAVTELSPEFEND